MGMSHGTCPRVAMATAPLPNPEEWWPHCPGVHRCPECADVPSAQLAGSMTEDAVVSILSAEDAKPWASYWKECFVKNMQLK
ncbi:unnamed protein product [Cyprideis torosa]|uniref:Uncharacterized protein n=1 Tax=Cyprideis torosa TaxID=163714 RepID=A0A7R8W897_9CRUS|nr:unnamed protein product [Cyprideis torosa]CAG0883546.1 unnamed protein product [Cyprideis torosa]